MPSMKEQALIFYDIITTFLCAHFARINVISLLYLKLKILITTELIQFYIIGEASHWCQDGFKLFY